jgi:hypothetical protein
MSREENHSHEALVFPGIPLALGEILRALPTALELQHPAAEERLFSSPGDADDGQLAEDWKAYVEPDLQQGFSEARQIVTKDLEAMKPSKKGITLRIPLHHRDAWVSVLTQARLAISAAHGLQEADLAGTEMPEIANTRDAAIGRVHFYGLLLEAVIASFEENEETDE